MIHRMFGLLIAAAALLASPAQAQEPKFDAAALKALDQIVDFPKAEAICAKGNDDNMCGWVGLSYLTGTGIAQDIEKGRKLVFEACGLGSSLACAVYEADNGGYAPDLRKLVHLIYLKSCEKQRGAGVGCFNAAQQLNIGFDVKQDKPKAAGLYLEGCAQGHGKSCLVVSQMAYTGADRPVDMAAAFEFGSIGCDLGDGTSCLMAIAAAQSGKIAPLERAQEAKLAQNACANAATQMCDNAVAFAQAKLPDAAAEAQAPRYARLGCEGKRGPSCRVYGQMLYSGIGFAKDEAAALAAFEQGCTVKDASSCYSLGAIAFNAGDKPRARAYLDKALAINPAHAEAKAALVRLATN